MSISCNMTHRLMRRTTQYLKKYYEQKYPDGQENLEALANKAEDAVYSAAGLLETHNRMKEIDEIRRKLYTEMHDLEEKLYKAFNVNGTYGLHQEIDKQKYALLTELLENSTEGWAVTHLKLESLEKALTTLVSDASSKQRAENIIKATLAPLGIEYANEFVCADEKGNVIGGVKNPQDTVVELIAELVAK